MVVAALGNLYKIPKMFTKSLVGVTTLLIMVGLDWFWLVFENLYINPKILGLKDSN